MGYERNDRWFDRERGYRPRAYEGDRYRRGRGYDDRESDYDRGDRSGRFARSDRDDGFERGRGDYDYDERGFFDRAGDELRSWFGDEEAERRRRLDARYDERYGRDWGARPDSYGYGFGGDLGLGGFAYPGPYREPRPRHDPHYREWRARQIEAYDRDYEAYCQENQARFDSDFASWRQSRQEKRDALSRVQEHQEVVGADGKHIGRVDKVRGERIILTKGDENAGGHHHSIPLSWIERVDDRVHVSKTADQALAHWRDEERSGPRARWLDAEDGREGPHYLNRSFRGTY